jgi:hypothetical protein
MTVDEKNLPPVAPAELKIRTGPERMEYLATEKGGPVKASKAKAIMKRFRAWSDLEAKTKMKSKSALKSAANRKKKADQLKAKKALADKAKAERKAKGLATRNRKKRRSNRRPPKNDN